MQTYDRRVANRIWQRRLAGALFGTFAALALLLAAVGLYGVLSYIVSQHTRDIGVRLALGATSDGIVREILARGLRPAIVGVAVGLGLVVAFGRLIAGMLYEVSPVDSVTLVLAPTFLLATAAPRMLRPSSPGHTRGPHRGVADRVVMVVAVVVGSYALVVLMATG